MAEVQKDYVRFNGIPKGCVHERTNSKDGSTFYSVSIRVPNEYSRDGYANVTVSKVFPTKNDPDKFNISFPEGWVFPKVEVCTYNDPQNKENNKYKDLENVPAKDLQSEMIKARKAAKDAKEAKAEEAPEEEEGMELG
jgi:hypothetical protein